MDSARLDDGSATTTLTITWLGHSSVVLDLDGARILADPLLRRHAGPLRRRGPRPDARTWTGADAVLLSHLHHDHADLPSLRMLPRDVPIVTAAQNAQWLRRRGLHGVSPGEEWVEVGDEGQVGVALCRAVHSSRPMPHRPNAANGHLVRTPSYRIWVAGDTALYDDLDELPEQAGGPIDLAVVPVSGWAPRLSGGHMGPEEAAEACLRVGARTAAPVHWGTLHVPGGRIHPRGWMDRPGPEFQEALSRLAPQCRALLLDIGTPTTLGPEGR